jgi:hypothetical protein
LFSVAYSTFDPANPGTNYKADPGASGTTMSYSVPLSAGANPLAFVVHETTGATGSGTAYTLKVTGACIGTCATPNQVPIARAHNVFIASTTPQNASIDFGSFDPDGDPLTITQSPAGPYPVGTTSVLLTVSDPKGATSQATANVTVRNTTPFTDNFLVPGLTVVKAIHITEMRSRVDLIRMARGLGQYQYANPTVSVGTTVILALHINDLRTALGQAYTIAGITVPLYSEPSLAAGAVVKAIHVTELRSAILGME